MADTITSAIQTAWGVLKLEDAKAKEAAKASFVNVLVIFAIAAIASAIGTLIMPSPFMGMGAYGMMGGGFVGTLIGEFVGMILLLLLWTAIVWVLMKIFGGNAGYMALYKALGHTYLANVLSIIPVLGAIGGIWAIVAQIVAVRSVAGLSTGKAAAVILIPLAIVIVIAIILVAIVGMALWGAAMAGGAAFQ